MSHELILKFRSDPLTRDFRVCTACLWAVLRRFRKTAVPSRSESKCSEKRRRWVALWRSCSAQQNILLGFTMSQF